MKIIKLLILCILFSSCVKNTTENTIDVIKFNGEYLQVVEIDSCEYLYLGGGNGSLLTHKGNCKNIIHHENKIKTTL